MLKASPVLLTNNSYTNFTIHKGDNAKGSRQILMKLGGDQSHRSFELTTTHKEGNTKQRKSKQDQIRKGIEMIILDLSSE